MKEQKTSFDTPIFLEPYLQFMNLDSFPPFTIEYYTFDVCKDFTPFAKAQYIPATRNHKLLLPSACNIPRFLLFHELTHILDMELLANGDKTHDFCLTGYMEYHASQIELLEMIGARTVDDNLTFSMHNCVDELCWTAQRYVNCKLETAKTMIIDSDQKTRIDGLGVLYNFLGLKSICNMYATDFSENYSYQEILTRIPTHLWFYLCQTLNGWINQEDINKAVILYSQMLESVK